VPNCVARAVAEESDQSVAIQLCTPEVDELGSVISALREWQQDALPIQLHPGDLGWFWRFGPQALAAALRLWRSNGEVVACGFLDGPDVLRMSVAPHLWRDEALAHRVLTDLARPEHGVLPAGKAAVEAPDGSLVKELLPGVGWSVGDPWTPLRRDLSAPVDEAGVRVAVVGPARVSEFTAVHRAAWGGSRFTDRLWHAMAAGLPYADARCLIAYDDGGVAVAGVTVWSAGQGRPGLLEPMGVHPEHRLRGYGRMVCVAAAAHLKELGSSSATVCTNRAPAVATYRAAGYQQLPVRWDMARRGTPQSG
jgi:GNAT superfamily N-acetyltransferase